MTTDSAPILAGVLHAAAIISGLVLITAVIDLSLLGMLAGVWRP